MAGQGLGEKNENTRTGANDEDARFPAAGRSGNRITSVGPKYERRPVYRSLASYQYCVRTVTRSAPGMADDAQRIAHETRSDYPKATAAWTLQEFNKRYGRVTFGSYFAETPLGFLGTPASIRKNVLGNRTYRGASGFPARFRDTLEPGEDQVHHFGAFFSAGLAGHKLIADQHRADDRDAGNMGDVRLGDQSRRLGD